MGRFAVIVLFVILCAGSASAQWRRSRQPQWPKTEGELVHKLLYTLQTKDTLAYCSLFPPFDTLWHMLMHNPDKSPETIKELNALKEHPQALIDFDPRYNYRIISQYAKVLAKGDDSGVFWKSMVMARYQLVKQEPTRNLIGYDKIAPERFRGYLFVTDPSNRVTFCISVAEIQKVKGLFFGGQVLNVLEAKSLEEFYAKEERERQYYEWLALHPDSALVDTTKADTSESADTTISKSPLAVETIDDDDKGRKEVIERKYYEGLLDNEIKIRLYIRYMRIVPGKPQQYDGLYKLGENKRYMRVEIAVQPDGKWTFDDELGVGTMELVLKGKTYNGQWTNSDENGFDVQLSLASAPQGKFELLDKILDKGISGRVDEEQFEEEIPKEKKKDKKKGGGEVDAKKSTDKNKKTDEKGEKEKPEADSNDKKEESNTKQGDNKVD